MKDENLPPPIWVILPDHMTAIRCWYPTYRTSMEFRVWRACETFDPPRGWEIIDDCSPTPLSKREQVEWLLDGFLKWDGCINWRTNPKCMMHGCSPNHIAQMTDIFQTIYHVGKRNLDLLGDPVPALPENAFEISDAE